MCPRIYMHYALVEALVVNTRICSGSRDASIVSRGCPCCASEVPTAAITIDLSPGPCLINRKDDIIVGLDLIA
jgi:hypothetical protein